MSICHAKKSLEMFLFFATSSPCWCHLLFDIRKLAKLVLKGDVSRYEDKRAGVFLSFQNFDYFEKIVVLLKNHDRMPLQRPVHISREMILHNRLIPINIFRKHFITSSSEFVMNSTRTRRRRGFQHPFPTQLKGETKAVEIFGFIFLCKAVANPM